jgi:predicted esterase
MNKAPYVKGPHQGQPVLRAGLPLEEAGAALILIHGRGASAYDIMSLGSLMAHERLAYLAPEAANHVWYPQSFLAPLEQNEPYLTSALRSVADVVALAEAVLPPEKIILAGFSQGACLASEFVARNPRRYGGLIAFSGGVIGPPGSQPAEYPGSVEGMPVFLGCSDTDAHIPLARVEETAVVFASLGAEVTKQIYPGMAHTVIQDEIDHANQIITAV